MAGGRNPGRDLHPRRGHHPITLDNVVTNDDLRLALENRHQEPSQLSRRPLEGIQTL